MRLLIFSDVHGSSFALQYLVDVCISTPHLQADHYRCLGDVFGYYSDPVGTWRLAYKLDPHLRLGNHDLYARTTLFGNRLGVSAAESEEVAFTNILHAEILAQFMAQDEAFEQQLKEYLTSVDVARPRIERDPDAGLVLCYVHGTPKRFENNEERHALEYLDCKKTTDCRAELFNALVSSQADNTGWNIAFIGHTHRPMIAFLKKDRLSVQTASAVDYKGARWTTPDSDHPLSLDEWDYETPLLINVGSVGQPRTGNHDVIAFWKINAVHLDTETRQLRFIQLTPPREVRRAFENGMRAYTLDWTDDSVYLMRLREYYRLRRLNVGQDADLEWAALQEIDNRGAQERWWDHRANLLGKVLCGFPMGDSSQYLYTYDRDGFWLRQL